MGRFQSQISGTSGNFSFIQAVASRQFNSGSMQIVCIYDGTRSCILSFQKLATERIHLNTSCSLGKNIGVGCVILGKNSFDADIKYGDEAGCTIGWKRFLHGYILRLKLGMNKSLGGLIAFSLLRDLDIGKLSIAVNINHGQVRIKPNN